MVDRQTIGLVCFMVNILVNNFQSCWDGAAASWVLPILLRGGV